MIMIYLAQHYKEDRYITLKEISQKEGVSLKYLEKIIVLINKDDYLLSLRGSDGGYKLSQEPKKYKVYDIIQKAEGDITISSCLNANFECCKRAKCRSYKLWNELNSVIINFLVSKTLDEFVEE